MGQGAAPTHRRMRLVAPPLHRQWRCLILPHAKRRTVPLLGAHWRRLCPRYPKNVCDRPRSDLDSLGPHDSAGRHGRLHNLSVQGIFQPQRAFVCCAHKKGSNRLVCGRFPLLVGTVTASATEAGVPQGHQAGRAIRGALGTLRNARVQRRCGNGGHRASDIGTRAAATGGDA